jgi:predicted aldo/keto reductase-like oxidoreductase
MDRVTMGKTGLQVSPLGMGVIPISRLEWNESLDVIRGVADLGINWFDTGRTYADTEMRLGEALQGKRNEVIIISKSMADTPEVLAAHIAETLERLKTDYLDVFLFHMGKAIEAQSFLAPGGLLEVAEDAVRAGKIRFLGFSAHSGALAMKALDVGSFSVAMVPANIVSREFIDGDFLARAQDKGVAVLAMKPFGGGRIEDPRLCLRFLRTYPGVLPCIGIEKVSEMAENIKTWDEGGPLNPQDSAEMERLRDLLGDRFCRGCEYCMPCPQGIQIYPVTFAQVYASQMPRNFFLGWYGRLMDQARTCVECRECEERCPYHLSIPEMLKESVAFFEEFSQGI